jgi:hypothetical protein
MRATQLGILFAHLTDDDAELDDDDDGKDDVDDEEVAAASLVSGIEEVEAGPYLILPAPLSRTTKRILLIFSNK